jgi:glycosyltransferase involved in cell wall biosynthesis
VVVIFLDAGRYLAEAIESVLAQDFDDWELLLVDDGSTDGSRGIAEAYAARMPGRIRYLTHPGRENRGMSASRNLGIRHARGRYVAMLDADDAWLPGMLAEQVAVLEREPGAAMVFGPTLAWYGWSGDPTDAARDWERRPWAEYDTVVQPPSLLLPMLRTRFAVPLGFLMRKEAVLEVGGYEETFRGMCEDQVFLSKMLLRHPVFLSSRCGYRYRQHPESCVAVALRAGERNARRLDFLRWLGRYLEREGVADAHLLRAVRREAWKCQYSRVMGRLGRMRRAFRSAVLSTVGR